MTGQFDPTTQKAVWPSTGNYCRGGAFDCALLGCTAIAILPEGMSRERFEWLKEIGAARSSPRPAPRATSRRSTTSAGRSARDAADEIVIFNQFEEFGNYVVALPRHRPALVEEVFERDARPEGDGCAATCRATGSAGTIAAGDYLERSIPGMRDRARPKRCSARRSP